MAGNISAGKEGTQLFVATKGNRVAMREVRADRTEPRVGARVATSRGRGQMVVSFLANSNSWGAGDMLLVMSAFELLSQKIDDHSFFVLEIRISRNSPLFPGLLQTACSEIYNIIWF